MDSSNQDIPKKRGRKPSGGRKEGVLVRMSPVELEALHKWIFEIDPKLSRPEAVRKLVKIGLEATGITTKG